MQIEKATKELHAAMKLVPEQIKRLEIEVSLCDQETQDLLHLIELSKFHASDGYKLCRDLQITLQKRRNFKDELSSLRAVVDKTKVDRPFLQQFDILSESLEHRKINMRARTYTPRVRSDLVERFNKCNITKLL